MKPILFNTEMTKAILEEHKSCTRRICKISINRNVPVEHTKCASVEYPARNFEGDCANFHNEDGYFVGASKQPFHVGDILYVRETIGYGYYAAWDQKTFYRADYDNKPDFVARWIPSIHMPKEEARIFLRVTDVRVERLQDIDNKQSKSEGAIDVKDFRKIWNSTNKRDMSLEYCWGANPWVWVISFEVISKRKAENN